MKLNEAENILQSIVPHHYNVPSEQVQEAKKTIIDAVKDGYRLHRDYYPVWGSINQDGPEEHIEDKEFGAKLAPCPFCGRNFVFYRSRWKDRNGHMRETRYFMHEHYEIGERDCILDEICMPFVIGAGDARPEDGYIGEYAEKWNNSLLANKVSKQGEVKESVGSEDSEWKNLC